jgi:hypothetical protein
MRPLSESGEFGYAPLVGPFDAAEIASAAHAASESIPLAIFQFAADRATDPVAQGEGHARHALVEVREARTLTDQDLVRLLVG